MPAAIPIAAAVAGGAISAMGSKSAAKTQADAMRDAANTPWKSDQSQSQTSTTALDPRIASSFFGSGGDTGLLGQIQSAIGQPRSPGAAAFGSSVDQLIGSQGGQMLGNIYQGNNALMRGYQEPAMQAAQVEAPGQDKLNLTPAYQNFIYGNSAQNPYLRESLQAGVDQSTQAFNTQLGDLTDTLQRQIMPGIRGSALASGQFGSSRQGIAEGLAMSDLTKQATNAARAFGLGNTAATTGAYANAYESGQNRALGALQGLGAQQYGAAQLNAQLRQAADMANMDALARTRGLNSENMRAGIQGSQGLLNNMSALANQNDQYGLTRAAQGVGLLTPFMNTGATTTSTGTTTGSGTGQPQPVNYAPNTGANALGGAMAGLGLYNQFSGLFNNPSAGATQGIGSGMAAQFPNGY